MQTQAIDSRLDVFGGLAELRKRLSDISLRVSNYADAVGGCEPSPVGEPKDNDNSLVLQVAALLRVADSIQNDLGRLGRALNPTQSAAISDVPAPYDPTERAIGRVRY